MFWEKKTYGLTITVSSRPWCKASAVADKRLPNPELDHTGFSGKTYVPTYYTVCTLLLS